MSNLKDDENPCKLTNEQLIEKCNQWVHKLAETGGRAWTLRVPVDFNNDPDVLFIEMIERLAATPATPSMQDYWKKRCLAAEKMYTYHIRDSRSEQAELSFSHWLEIFKQEPKSENPSPIPVKDRTDYLKQKFAEHLGVPELETSDAYAIEWAIKSLNV